MPEACRVPAEIAAHQIIGCAPRPVKVQLEETVRISEASGGAADAAGPSMPREGWARYGEVLAFDGETSISQEAAVRPRSDWNSPVITPKGGRLRYMLLITVRLAAVLRAVRRAKLSQESAHILHHSFCSSLAMLNW